jgi:flagellar protein FliS
MNKTQYPPGSMNPEAAYLRGEVETADPMKLLLLLYNRLLREMREIRDRIGTKAVDSGTTKLPADIDDKFDRCRDILAYLIDSLNPEAGEVTHQFHRMYAFFYETLVEAQMEKDGRIIDEILPNLETIREGWIEIAGRKE